ncbi:TPA: sulfite exporter TauE/SafE family protein, partial [Candidatus Bathyarchaeota archaeon]|nr:sulfite exporter TauE/SafE family protein [Candidatus Bathyarchaeota archaeon]
MKLILLETLANFAVGFLTGVYATLFGLGGGFIFVPYFYLGLSMPVHKAIGSS